MIFDTDVLIWALRGNRRAASCINLAAVRQLSIVSLMELLQGARSASEARQVRASLGELQFKTLPLTESIGGAAAALIEAHALSHGIRVADALIAATALEHGSPLCTGNIKRFRAIRALPAVAFRP